MNDILVIGYGNSLRSDDAAGVRAAEVIEERYPSVECLCVENLGPALVDVVASHASVVFMDASVAVARVQARELQAALPTTKSFSHTCTPEELLGLAQFLYDSSPARAMLFEIPASRTGFGTSLSPSARLAVQECVGMFEKLFGLGVMHLG